MPAIARLHACHSGTRGSVAGCGRLLLLLLSALLLLLLLLLLLPRGA